MSSARGVARHGGRGSLGLHPKNAFLVHIIVRLPLETVGRDRSTLRWSRPPRNRWRPPAAGTPAWAEERKNALKAKWLPYVAGRICAALARLLAGAGEWAVFVRGRVEGRLEGGNVLGLDALVVLELHVVGLAREGYVRAPEVQLHAVDAVVARRREGGGFDLGCSAQASVLWELIVFHTQAHRRGWRWSAGRAP